MPNPLSPRVLWQSPAGEPIAARIAVAGDFLPAGRLSTPPGHTWQSMAELIAPVFQDVDIGIANLETVLDSSGLEPRLLHGLGDIVSAPSGSLDYLVELRLNILGIANNHSFDFGAAGLTGTLASISARGLRPLGSARTLRDPPDVFLWQGPENLRVGFWASAKATRDPATRRSAGVEPATPFRGLEALRTLRAHGAQFCIALLHAGCLRTSHPDPEDVRLLDSLAGAGFDIVAASHSHRISGARVLSSAGRPAFCFYGIGSLVSGYVSSPLEAEGLVVVASLSSQGTLVQLEVRPILLSEDGWSFPPDADASNRILERFDTLSRQVADGSFAACFYRDMSDTMLRVYWRDARAAFCESGVSGLLHKAGRVRMRHVKRLVRAVVG